MPDPMPFGDTSFRAIVRAISVAEPVNVRGGGKVESVLTCRTHRFGARFFAFATGLLLLHPQRFTRAGLVPEEQS
jgi:hypothetical protein